MIYILSPASIHTGGPELLHQLGYKLRLMGFDACMFYYNRRENISPVAEGFEKYDVPIADTIIDDVGNIVVFPEAIIDSIPGISNAIPVLWWMSVDNAKVNAQREQIIKENKRIVHFSQSQYSTDYLINEMGIEPDKVYYLSDYINSVFLNQRISGARENVIAFNPKKGWDFTQNLIAMSNGNVAWRAIRGLNAEEVREVLKKSKVYIDFGNHPGKDRIPREAALCGCCVITGRKGSARNAIDINIPDEFKFNDEAESVGEILNRIYSIMANYDGYWNKYSGYVRKIQNEYIEFEKDVLKLFNMLNGIETPHVSQEEYIRAITEDIQNNEYQGAYTKLLYYRLNGYEEDMVISVLDAYIRFGIGEYNEAEFILREILKDNPNDAEINVLLARAIVLANSDSISIKEGLKYCDNAINLATDTPDSEVINALANEVMQYVKDLLS